MDFISAYRARLREIKTEVAEAVAEGACSDFGDYRDKTGIIKGLDYALMAISETLQEDEEDLNDEATPPAGLENIDQKEEA